MQRFILALLLVLLATTGLVSCGAPLPNYPYAKEPDPRRAEYVIGVGDTLRIRIWKNPELNTDIQVRPDGTITMSLIGDVHAADLTPTQLKHEIKKKMSVFIKDEAAVVTVAVTDVRSYRVTVSGNVAQPGVLSAERYLTVLEAIALAGGPNRFASPAETKVIRVGSDGKVRHIPIRYDLLAEGEHLEMNLVLLRGDQVFVP